MGYSQGRMQQQSSRCEDKDENEAAMTYPLLTVSSESERLSLLSTKDWEFVQAPERRRCRIVTTFLRMSVAIAIAGIWIWASSIPYQPILSGPVHDRDVQLDDFVDSIPHCTSKPCFTPAKIRVPSHFSGFPSFWNYGHRGPLHVSYDKRSITINGDRAFFIGGSMHPSRATKLTWNLALDEAVRNGLNLITIYVMWSAHQPLPNADIDWRFPQATNVECASSSAVDDTCTWDLAAAIQAAANRGLFVHLRVGPYDCAEYSYGGIPEWLPLHKPKMQLRRPNVEWLEAMEGFIASIVNYISEHQLWAFQGGNIVLAQIENELGEDASLETSENLLLVDPKGRFVDPNGVKRPSSTLRNATVQDYANWCGALAAKLAPNVTWTMCNGLSANNTILTCNAVSEGDSWLEHHGGNGRIQIDQPAMLTEFEGGFQTWGSTPEKPLDYFWGRTARAMTRDALKWFARGGCHLNLYMFWGGYNRQRAAAAGITNLYASDVLLCPSGQRHQPKFGHFQALHEAMAGAARTLLHAESALGKNKTVRYLAPNGTWQRATDQRVFEYQVPKKGYKTITFLENDATTRVVVQLKKSDSSTVNVTLNAESAILLVNGEIEFDSSSIDPQLFAFERKYVDSQFLPVLLDWSSWQEPIGADYSDEGTWTKSAPVEQTELNIDSAVFSDYAWYETEFTLDQTTNFSKVYIETQKASAFVVFVDKEYVGAADNHLKGEGPVTLTISMGMLSSGSHTLSLLSESLGYNNLIGRWGGSTVAKPKGITGAVNLDVGSWNMSLVDGREWRSYPGLHGETINRGEISRENLLNSLESGRSETPTWSSALFDSPRYDPTFQSFFAKVTSGRGHLWLNGKDLGRYWNITRGETSTYSQKHYLLPHDFLRTDGHLNELTFFNAFGEIGDSVQLELSWIDPSYYPNFKDEVDFADACI